MQNLFWKHNQEIPPVNRSGCFLKTFSWRSLHSCAMTHLRFTIWLKCWFAACHINHISPSLSLSYATMVFQHENPERPQLLANSSTLSARPETACVRSSPPSCCMFFLLLGETSCNLTSQAKLARQRVKFEHNLRESRSVSENSDGN